MTGRKKGGKGERRKGGRKEETREVDNIFFVNMRIAKPGDEMPRLRPHSNKQQKQD